MMYLFISIHSYDIYLHQKSPWTMHDTVILALEEMRYPPHSPEF